MCVKSYCTKVNSYRQQCQPYHTNQSHCNHNQDQHFDPNNVKWLKEKNHLIHPIIFKTGSLPIEIMQSSVSVVLPERFLIFFQILDTNFG